MPSSDSTRRWRQPTSVKAFASQANAVATLLLNGEIDVEVARAYSGIARTVAAAISNETSRARFARLAPDLTLDADVFDDDGAHESGASTGGSAPAPHTPEGGDGRA